MYGLRDPLGNITIQRAIGRVVQYAIGFSGALFLAYFIYGGFMWMTAGGDTTRVTKAQHALRNAILGIGIIVFSYTLISLILGFTDVLTGAS
jgi:amino acid permease